MAKGSGGTKGAVNGNKTTASGTGAQSFGERGIQSLGAEYIRTDGSKAGMLMSNVYYGLTEAKFENLMVDYPEIGEVEAYDKNLVGRKAIKVIASYSTSAKDFAARLNKSEIAGTDWKAGKSTGDIVRITRPSWNGAGEDALYVKLKMKK